MVINILVGGRAGQGINLISGMLSRVLASWGYYTFNYRDYQSLIRGGHNFNVLSVSKEPIYSNESTIDVMVALDDRTVKTHKKQLKRNGKIISFSQFKDAGRNLNFALAGALLKTLGMPVELLEDEIKKRFGNDSLMIESARKGFDSEKVSFGLEPQKSRKIFSLSGSAAVAIGAKNSGLDVYIAYPMTPSTNALHEMAKNQLEDGMLVFQAENEISVANMALGASFAGARVMIGTSGGGFDLMSETLSLQGITEIPLTVYLASRPGPGTGVPTYTAQADLDIALRAGHGEFPRVVIAPGTAEEVIEKVSEALFLAEKFRVLSILLSDKHIAESEYAVPVRKFKTMRFSVSRDVPGRKIVRASSYECSNNAESTEDASLVKRNVDRRLKKYELLKKFVSRKFEMFKVYGNTRSRNLIIGWGSPTGAILDVLKRGVDVCFLQVIYLKPLSDKIKRFMEKAERIVLVENNATGQLGRLLREKTGIKPHRKILKYDGRPFNVDELEKEVRKAIK
ncbi:hypothetical protein D6829_01925 [Candidatus Pacearchaeota archaeon]|nr:MAG: hypothetical protein D6829_01925 [Candidatus Pacearchaeota archaeon]